MTISDLLQLKWSLVEGLDDGNLEVTTVNKFRVPYV